MRANLQTINVLKHSLRRAQRAEKLKALRTELKFPEKYGRYSSSALNVAACMAILILMKIGVFSSMNTFQNQGQKVIEKYYVNRIGDDLAEDIFPNKQNTPVI
jgi:shikimate kinase